MKTEELAITGYKSNPTLLIQKDRKIRKYRSVIEAVSDNVEFTNDEPVMVISVGGKFFTLNLFAAILLDQIEQYSSTFQELVYACCNLFEVDEKIAISDVQQFINFCAENGILVSDLDS
jgi:hypothetical protein